MLNLINHATKMLRLKYVPYRAQTCQGIEIENKSLCTEYILKDSWRLNTQICKEAAVSIFRL